MFDLRSGDELSFVINSSNSSQQEDKLSFDDLISDQAFLGCNINPTSVTTTITTTTTIKTVTNDTKKQMFIEFGVQESKTEKNNELNIRNNMRRDLERRRRHDMANLYASLRTLLPFERIKGKRPISDHMQEAVNYIKQKQKNIQEMRIKLKELSDLSDNVKNSVMVNAETNGVEILISASLINPRFRISRVFVELMERELNVVNWVSTKANGKFFHRIQAEASGVTCIDPSVLQERLIYVINN